MIVVAAFAAPGLVAVQPNETKVLIVFGRYTGTVRRPGLSYTNPLTAIWRTNVSVRVRNFQTATAIVAARQTIVEGAVGLVDMALERISARGIVELDDERKAAMVSNLMVVLTGDRAPTPVINAGTLYGS